MWSQFSVDDVLPLHRLEQLDHCRVLCVDRNFWILLDIPYKVVQLDNDRGIP